MNSKNFRRSRWHRQTRLCFGHLEERLAPAGGLLDSGFGTGGIARTPFPLLPSLEGANAVAVDSQSRTIVAGYVNNGANNDFLVARYLANGTLDSSFGTGGVVTNFFGGMEDSASAVAVDFLDRVVVAGFAVVGDNFEMAIARLTTSGVLDTGFSGDGLLTLSFGSTQAYASGVAIDALNRIVVAGSVLVGTKFDVGVARLTGGGALDTTFSGDGLHLIDFNGGDDFGTGVAVDSLNRPVISVTLGGATSSIGVVRMTAAGALDNSFDGDGRQTITFAAGNENSYGISIDNADRPLVVGHTDPTGTNRSFAVARLTTAGALDNTYNLNGKQTIAFASPVQPRGIKVDSMGRAVVVGTIVVSGQNDFAVARLNAAGGLDTGFNGTGRHVIAVTTKNDFGQAVTVDFFDRVLLAGRGRPSFTDDVAVVRLTSGGLLDLTFNGTGIQTTGLINQIPTGGAQTAVVDSMGRIVVAGFVSNGPDNDFGITRLLPSGVVDTSFGTNGFVTVDFGGTQDAVASVALDSLGRIVVAGYAQTGMSFDFAVARLTSTGKLDTTFDGDGKQTITFGPGNEIASGVAVDSKNRVIVVGTVTGPSTNNFAVACLTESGQLDTNFNGDGRRVFAFGTGDEFGQAVAIDASDRIVVVGHMFNGANNDLAIARLTGAGQFDLTFNGTGKRTVDFDGTDDFGRGVVIDGQNRIVVGGDNGNIVGGKLIAARLTAEGTLDNSFAGNGRATVNFAGDFTQATGVRVDSANRVILAGSTAVMKSVELVAARLTQSGTLDPTFNGTGKQSIAFSGANPVAGGLGIDAAGRPLLVGSSQQSGVNIFTTVRLTNPAQVASIAVENDSGQRSLVRSMTVEFGTPVSFVGSPTAAFQLVQQGTMTNVTLGATLNPGGHSVTLTFSGSAVESSGSLADGRYTLTVFADQFNGTPFEGGGAGNNYVEVGSPTSANKLFRLFGDSNGDGSVTALDFNAFRLAYGAGPSIFDFDGDNTTSAADFNQFRLRYGFTI